MQHEQHTRNAFSKNKHNMMENIVMKKCYEQICGIVLICFIIFALRILEI